MYVRAGRWKPRRRGSARRERRVRINRVPCSRSRNLLSFWHSACRPPTRSRGPGTTFSELPARRCNSLALSVNSRWIDSPLTSPFPPTFLLLFLSNVNDTCRNRTENCETNNWPISTKRRGHIIDATSNIITC